MSKHQLMPKPATRAVSLEQDAVLPTNPVLPTKQHIEQPSQRQQTTDSKLTKASIGNIPGVSRTARTSTQRSLLSLTLSKRSAQIKTGQTQRASLFQSPSYVPTALDRFVTWLAQRIRAVIDRMLGFVPQQFWLLELLKRRQAEKLARENERQIAQKAKASATPAIKR